MKMYKPDSHPINETDKTILQIIIVTIISFFAVIFLLGLALLLFGMKVTEDWEPYVPKEQTFEEFEKTDKAIEELVIAATEGLEIMNEMEDDGFIEDVEEGLEILNELKELLEEWEQN